MSFWQITGLTVFVVYGSIYLVFCADHAAMLRWLRRAWKPALALGLKGIGWLMGAALYLAFLAVVFFLSPYWAGILLLITLWGIGQNALEKDHDKRQREIIREEIERSQPTQFHSNNNRN